MKQPVVSVLLPVYNGAKYLRSAIDSILKQSFVDYEIIIINDGSLDDSQEIIDSFSDSRIQNVLHTANLGLIASLNEGLSLSRGEYIARMDQDDISLPSRLDKQLSCLKNNPDTALVGSLAAVIDVAGNVQDIQPVPIHPKDIELGLTIKNCFIHGSVMINKKVIPKEMLFYPTEYIHAEDYAFWLKLKKQGYAMQNIPEALYYWRSHNSSISKRANVEQQSAFQKLFDEQSQARSLVGIEELRYFYHNAVKTIPEKIEVAGKKIESNLKRDYQYILFTWAKDSFWKNPVLSALASVYVVTISFPSIITYLLSRKK